MHFLKNFNRASRSIGLCQTAKRKNVTLSAACAVMFVAGLLAMSGSAAGFQAKTSQPPASPAQPSTQPPKPQDVSARQEKLPESRIAELRAFAKTHHPEIMPLLDFLEKKRPKKFNKVMAGLNRNVSNLERLQKKSAEAYQRGLATWINQSRVNLYAAQFKVAADDATAAELRKKIRTLIEENIDARISHLERDLANSKEKTARLQKVADEIKAKRDATVEKKIANATKNAPNMNKRGKKAAQPIDKAGSKKTGEREPATEFKANPNN